MTTAPNPPAVVAWRTSTRSTGQNQCVEMGALTSGTGIAIRDSKSPGTGTLLVDGRSFRELASQIKNGCFDRY